MPKNAKAVAKALRMDVPKPRTKDFLIGRFVNEKHLTEQRDGQGRCPMGLHPAAQDACPSTTFGLPILPTENVMSFGIWWDGILGSDITKAIRTIWGDKKVGT